MRVGRSVARAACCILVACLVFTGDDPRGGRIRAAAASSSATVQVEYKGTWTATFSQTTYPNDGRGKREQKSVTTVHWDFVWTGTLDQLLFPFKYPLSRKAGSNYFAPRLLTGTTSVTYAGYGEPPDCTGTLSYNPAGFPPPLFSFVTQDPNPNKILLTVTLPSGQRILRSSNLRASGPYGAGDCNAGDYRASPTSPNTAELYTPHALFSQANLTKKQTQTFSGVYKGSRAGGYVGSDVINSSVSLVAALCTGSGSSNDVTHLFGCYVALGDLYSAGQMPPFVPGGETCLRSTRSYAYLYDKNVAFAACSGAKIADVLSTQLLFVRTTTKLVSITISGNDSGIINTFVACLGKSFLLNRCENAYPPPDFASLKSRLIALYGAIYAQAPAARIFVFGYPLALPPTAPRTCAGLSVPYTPMGVFPSDVPYFYRLLTTLNDTVHQAAQASPGVTFVSPDLIFSGHDVCSSSSYFFPLNALNGAESLHPNAQGHAELAALLHRAAGPPPD